jgi:hypothetical protein
MAVVAGSEQPGSGAGARLIVSGGASTLVGTDALLAQESAMRMLHAAAVEWQATLVRIRALDTAPAPFWAFRDSGLDVLAAAAALDVVEAESRRLADAVRTAAEGYGRAEQQAESAARVTAASVGWAFGRFPQLVALVALSAMPILTTGMVIWLFRQAWTSGGQRGGQPIEAIEPRARSAAPVTGRGGYDSARIRAPIRTPAWGPAWAPEWAAAPPPTPTQNSARAQGSNLAQASGRDDRSAKAPFDARLLTSPLAAAFVRVAVSSLDDVAIGALGLPLPVALGFGDDGVGALGVGTSAVGLLAVARPLGLLRETPVTVEPVGPLGQSGRAGRMNPGVPRGPAPNVVSAAPPAGLADLAARIPTLSEDGGQVRIERYGGENALAWVVYIGGTAEWSPVTETEPWDLTSNLAAVAHREAGSYRAVVQAMHEAGVQPGEPVIEVGHSQGGLIAAQVAASGEFATVATLTFGAPSGQVPVVQGVDTVAVEHTDDIVPGMGGASADATDRLLVRREVYGASPIPLDVALPAHSMTNYAETARLIDSSPEPRLRAFREQVVGVVGSAPGTGALWRGTRTEGG